MSGLSGRVPAVGRSTPVVVVAAPLFLAVYFASAIDRVGAVRALLVVLVAGSLLALGLAGTLRGTARGLAVTVGLVAPLLYLVAHVAEAGAAASKGVTYAVVLVPAAVLGGCVRAAGLTRLVASTYVGVSVAVAALALFEVVTRSTVFDRPDLGTELQFRDGQLRAVVGAEHPIVLGAMLALGAVVAVLALRRVPAALAALVLLAGVLGTVSRGAFAVAAGGLLLAAFVRWTRWPVPPRLAHALALVSLPLLVVAFVARTSVGGAVDSPDAVEASAQYRSAILYAIPDQLASAPFGRGPAGLPPGEVVIPTQGAPLDLAASVDSEIGLLAFEFGVPGLAAFVLLWVLAVSQVLQRRAWALPALVVLATGFSVGLHAWVGLGTLWMLTTGVLIAAATERRRTSTSC